MMGRISRVLRTLRKKVLKSLAKSVPGNGIRVRLLRLSGYSLGQQVYIGEDIIIVDDLGRGDAGLIIEDRVAVSPRVTFVLHSAPNWSRIRPHVKERFGTITVKNDAWIGAGAIILPQVTIGEGAVVAANAVVTADVSDYTVVGGLPARPLGRVRVPWRPGPDETITTGLDGKGRG